MSDQAWFTRAACRGVAEETLTATSNLARRVCDGCPVKTDCLDAAMTEEKGPASYRYGVRGGLTPLDRERLARGVPLTPPKQQGRPRTPLVHGTAGFQRGCRCDVCRTARTTYNREYARRRAAQRRAMAAAAGGGRA